MVEVVTKKNNDHFTIYYHFNLQSFSKMMMQKMYSEMGSHFFSCKNIHLFGDAVDDLAHTIETSRLTINIILKFLLLSVKVVSDDAGS